MLNRGKWGNPNIPQSGWTCIDSTDLGEPMHVCQMCEHQICRYVYTMTHPDYPEPLAVGCVCSGEMEGDLVAAHEREKKLKRQPRKPISEDAKTWIAAADKMLAHSYLINPKELTFINDMRRRFSIIPDFNPSERQVSWFADLFRRICPDEQFQ